jgi:phosphoesterase RecJ-like protein
MGVERERGLAAAARAIEDSRSVVATGHVNPDGDALGAALGLALTSRARGGLAHACFGGGFVLPRHFAFLDTAPLVDPSEVKAPDVLVAFDVNDPARLGDEMEWLLDSARTVVMIDHHVSGPGFGDIRVSDPSVAAASLLCYRLVGHLGWALTPAAATGLLLGLVTDTGRFQYSNTNPEALRTAAALVEAGARPEVIGREVYESAACGYLGLAGEVLTRAVLEPPGSLVWSYMTQDDLRRRGIGMEDSDGLIDAVRIAREAEVALLAKEQPDGTWKLSLRSRRHVDVASIAEEMGGGGHRRASGFSFEGSLDEVMREVRSRLPG